MVDWITENPNKRPNFNNNAFGLDEINTTPGSDESALEFWFPDINNQNKLNKVYDAIGIKEEKIKPKGVGKYKLPDISTVNSDDMFDPYIQDKMDKLKLNLPSIKSADGTDSFIQNKIDALKLKNKREQEAKEKAEYDNSFKGRLNTLWEDGSKRNAILSGISETLLETRVGADAYGNRFRDLPGTISSKMQQAEALDMVKDQAMLDMIKTQAETQAAMDPRQFLSNTQKNARDFASAKGHVIGSKEWNTAYAGAIQEMTMENLLTAPVEGIAAISELLARNTGMFDESTITLFQNVISQLTNRIQGEPMGKSRSDKVVIQGGTDN